MLGLTCVGLSLDLSDSVFEAVWSYRTGGLSYIDIKLVSLVKVAHYFEMKWMIVLIAGQSQVIGIIGWEFLKVWKVK